MLSSEQAATTLEGVLGVVTENPPQPPAQCVAEVWKNQGELRTRKSVIFHHLLSVVYSSGL